MEGAEGLEIINQTFVTTWLMWEEKVPYSRRRGGCRSLKGGRGQINYCFEMQASPTLLMDLLGAAPFSKQPHLDSHPSCRMMQRRPLTPDFIFLLILVFILCITKNCVWWWPNGSHKVAQLMGGENKLGIFKLRSLGLNFETI